MPDSRSQCYSRRGDVGTWLILYGPDGELATFEAWYE